MKKPIIGLSVLAILSFFVFPSTSFAYANVYSYKTGGSPETVCYNGFVPCGKTVYFTNRIIDGHCDTAGVDKAVISCQFCHFFVLIDGIIKFVLVDIVPYLALLMVVVGGAMFFLGGANPKMVTTGKKTLEGVLIGLFLVYGSYMIVALFLTVLGVTSASGLQEWAGSLFSPQSFSIKCNF